MIHVIIRVSVAGVSAQLDFQLALYRPQEPDGRHVLLIPRSGSMKHNAIRLLVEVMAVMAPQLLDQQFCIYCSITSIFSFGAVKMADAGTSTKQAKSKIAKKKWLCGTPPEHCTGSLTKMSAHMKSAHTHGSPQEAFTCYATYLVDVLKYKKVGSREFEAPPSPENPGGGPIRVLTKKARFGARLRGGKEGRSMPYEGVGGTMVSL